jgi:hypothetical protein
MAKRKKIFGHSCGKNELGSVRICEKRNLAASVPSVHSLTQDMITIWASDKILTRKRNIISE